MTRRPLALTALLLVAALAGCASEDPETESADAAADPVSDRLSADIGAPVIAPTGLDNASLSVATPFVLPATSGPDSPLTAFEWRIPEGGILEYEPYPGVDFSVEEVVFEVVPIFPDGNGSLEEFAILAVAFEDGEAYVASSYIGVPIAGIQTGPLGNAEISYEPELQPFRFYVYAGSLEAGDRLGFILMGRSAEPGTFGLLVSPRAEPVDRDEDDDVPADAGELLQGRTPVTLEPSGVGAGFQVAYYFSNNINFLTSIYHTELSTPHVTVEDRLPLRTPEPLVTARDMTVSASYPGRGHSEAFGYYFMGDLLTPSCTSVVQYDLATDLHGTAVQHRSVDVEVPAASLPTTLVTGSPYMFAIGEGDGAATTTAIMDIKTACGYESFSFEQFDLGATFQELFGAPGMVGGAAFSGLLGDFPPVLSNVDGDLVIRDGARQHRMAGFGSLAHSPGMPA